MNERIKELAEQAYVEDSIEQNPRYKKSEITDYLLKDLEGTFKLFAELIIKECLDVLDPTNDLTSMREEFGRRTAMRIIKSHFGVE